MSTDVPGLKLYVIIMTARAHKVNIVHEIISVAKSNNTAAFATATPNRLPGVFTQVQCCFTSTETVRDGEPRTATSTSTHWGSARKLTQGSQLLYRSSFWRCLFQSYVPCSPEVNRSVASLPLIQTTNFRMRVWFIHVTPKLPQFWKCV